MSHGDHWAVLFDDSFVRPGIRPVEAEDSKQGSIGLYAPADRLGGHVPHGGDEVEGGDVGAGAADRMIERGPTHPRQSVVPRPRAHPR